MHNRLCIIDYTHVVICLLLCLCNTQVGNALGTCVRVDFNYSCQIVSFALETFRGLSHGTMHHHGRQSGTMPYWHRYCAAHSDSQTEDVGPREICASQQNDQYLNKPPR